MNENKYFVSGQRQYEKGMFKAAIGDFTKALELEPTNAYIYCERGISWYHLRENQKALEDMDMAQKFQPDNPYRYSSRAYIKEKMGDIKGAIADYKITLKLDPEDAIAWNNLGILEEKLGFEPKEHFNKADKLAEKHGLNGTATNGTGKKTDAAIFQEESKTAAKSIIGSYLELMWSVFRSKKTFGEFRQFISGWFR